jgi:hypothetical protein
MRKSLRIILSVAVVAAMLSVPAAGPVVSAHGTSSKGDFEAYQASSAGRQAVRPSASSARIRHSLNPLCLGLHLRATLSLRRLPRRPKVSFQER